jgi:hypothetical protein
MPSTEEREFLPLFQRESNAADGEESVTSEKTALAMLTLAVSIQSLADAILRANLEGELLQVIADHCSRVQTRDLMMV